MSLLSEAVEPEGTEAQQPENLQQKEVQSIEPQQTELQPESEPATPSAVAQPEPEQQAPSAVTQPESEQAAPLTVSQPERQQEEPQPESIEQPQQQPQQEEPTAAAAPPLQEVPQLNIETPDRSDLPEFLKKQIKDVETPEQKLSQEFASQQASPTMFMPSPSASSSSAVTPSAALQGNSLQDFGNTPPSSDIPTGSTDIENAKNDVLMMGAGGVEGLPPTDRKKTSKGSSKSINSAEETEAMKEEREANKLIESKDEVGVQSKIQDRPDIIGLGGNGMTAPVDKDALNMQTGNMASPAQESSNEIMDQTQDLMMEHLRGDMDKIHEGKTPLNK